MWSPNYGFNFFGSLGSAVGMEATSDESTMTPRASYPGRSPLREPCWRRKAVPFTYLLQRRTVIGECTVLISVLGIPFFMRIKTVAT